MSPSPLATTLGRLVTSIATRLNASRRPPLPFSGVCQQIGALVHTPHGAALLLVIAVALVVYAVRSGWREPNRRWYPR